MAKKKMKEIGKDLFFQIFLSRLKNIKIRNEKKSAVVFFALTPFTLLFFFSKKTKSAYFVRTSVRKMKSKYIFLNFA